MTRPAGQVQAWQMLVGLLAVAAFVSAVIALSDWLLPPAQQLPDLPAPAEDEVARDDRGCPVSPPVPGGNPIEVASSELFECPDSYDGVTVAYQGEAVGAVLRRGARAWLQLNDDAYALTAGPLPQHRTALGGNSGVAVSVPVGLAAEIRFVGGHDHIGARVAVVGEFRRADPDDGGGPTILAASARIVEPGEPLAHPVVARRLWVAAALAVLVVLAGLRAWRTIRRELGLAAI